MDRKSASQSIYRVAFCGGRDELSRGIRSDPPAEPRRDADFRAIAVARAVGADLGGCVSVGGAWAELSPSWCRVSGGKNGILAHNLNLIELFATDEKVPKAWRAEIAERSSSSSIRLGHAVCSSRLVSIDRTTSITAAASRRRSASLLGELSIILIDPPRLAAGPLGPIQTSCAACPWQKPSAPGGIQRASAPP